MIVPVDALSHTLEVYMAIFVRVHGFQHVLKEGIGILES
jgi:hypothetical protein